MLEVFCQPAVASVLFSSVVSARTELTEKVGSVIGRRLEASEAVVERRTLNKVLSDMDNHYQALHHTADTAITLYNSSPLSDGYHACIHAHLL